MRRVLRYAAVAAASAYLGAGLFAGLLTQRAIPALNPLGVALIAAIWPNQIRCARVSSGCEAIPAWAAPYIFTFSNGERAAPDEGGRDGE